MAIPGIILLVIGLRGQAKAKKAAFIRAQGIQGTANLISASPTGLRINRVPQYALKMSIQIPGKEPYEAITKIVVGPAAAGMLTPEFTAPVRVHPKDPTDFILELD